MLKIRKEGVVYIIICGLIFFFFFVLTFKYNNFIFLILSILILIPTFFIIYFFRDPERIPDRKQDKDYLCPADGEVVVVDEDFKEENLMKKRVLKISIFMNVLSVHVNRSPFKGKIKKIVYVPGLFMPAFKDLSSVENERVDILLSTAYGETRVALVAGILARRVVPFIHLNQAVDKGERIGMIKFGSRVDCYIPKEFKSLVKVGDKVFAGKTILAEKR